MAACWRLLAQAKPQSTRQSSIGWPACISLISCAGATSAFFIVQPLTNADIAVPTHNGPNHLRMFSSDRSRLPPESPLGFSRLRFAVAIFGGGAIAHPPASVQDCGFGNIDPAAG